MDRTNAPGHVNHLFVAEDPATNRAPTELVAEDFNAHQEELMAVIEGAGLVPDSANNGQVLEAIKVLIEDRVGDFSLDTGTANAKVVALNPAIIAYADNFGGSFKNLLLNTGPVTVNFGGGVIPLVREDGVALIAGDLPAGAVVGYQYIHADGKAYVTNMVAAHAITAAEDPTGADNSTRAATTGWLRNALSYIFVSMGFAISLTKNGYIKLPSLLGGLIFQWNLMNSSASADVTWTFPVSFPTALFFTCGVGLPGSSTANYTFSMTSSYGNATTKFGIFSSSAGTRAEIPCFLLSIGY